MNFDHFRGLVGVGWVGEDAAEVSVFESVGVAFEGDDFGVVDEPVDHGSGDDLVAEDFAPAAEWLVAGDDQARIGWRRVGRTGWPPRVRRVCSRPRR